MGKIGNIFHALSKVFDLRRYREYIYMKRGNNVKYVLQDEIEGYGHFNNEKILIVDDNDTNPKEN